VTVGSEHEFFPRVPYLETNMLRHASVPSTESFLLAQSRTVQGVIDSFYLLVPNANSFDAFIGNSCSFHRRLRTTTPAANLLYTYSVLLFRSLLQCSSSFVSPLYLRSAFDFFFNRHFSFLFVQCLRSICERPEEDLDGFNLCPVDLSLVTVIHS
jgi:hypothetical protein